METTKRNREVIGNIGDLVEMLYDEIEPLPFSETARNAMVMIMVADALKSSGSTVTFQVPLDRIFKEAAA